MLLRVLVILALTAGGLAAAPGQAAAPAGPAADVFVPATDGAVRGLSSYGAAGEVGPAGVRGAWSRRQIAALAGAGAHPQVLAAAQAAGRGRAVMAEESGTFVVISSGEAAVLPSALFEAGDLDGDRRTDLLDVRYAAGKNRTATLALVARNARTGAVLWSKQIHVGAGHVVLPVAAKIGAPARDGVLLYDFGFGQESSSASLTALAGRTGAVTWRYRAAGTTSFDGDRYTGTQVPYFAGVLAGPGATQLLVAVADYEYVFGESSTTQSGTTQPYVIDGATGRARPLGAAAKDGDSVPALYSLADASGDGRADAGFVIGGADSQLQLRDGSTGKPLWTHAATGEAAYALPVGRVTGAAAEDVALVTMPAPDPLQDRTPLGSLAPRTAAKHGQVVLLAGRDGTRSASVPGDFAFPLAPGGGRPAFGVVTTDTATDVAGETTVSMRVSSHDAAGAERWSRTLEQSAKGEDGFAGGFVYDVGDLERDGALELRALLFVYAGDKETSSRTLLSGATGDVLQRAGEALYGSLSSHGDDLVTVGGGKGALVTARSGRTGKPVWSVRLGAPAEIRNVQAYAADVRGDACDDIVVTATGPKSDYVAVLSNTGRLRWSATGAPGGVQVRPARAVATPVTTCR